MFAAAFFGSDTPAALLSVGPPLIQKSCCNCGSTELVVARRAKLNLEVERARGQEVASRLDRCESRGILNVVAKCLLMLNQGLPCVVQVVIVVWSSHPSPSSECSLLLLY